MSTQTGLQLAQHVHELSADNLSASTRETAACCVLDLLCAAAAGFSHTGTRAARAAAPGVFGHGSADIWFSGMTASPSAALLANSVAASAHDLDDGYRRARGHPGAAVIPAVWSMLSYVAHEVNADDFLTAIVAGYEAGIRFALGRLAYSPSGAWSPYAVIAAAGKLSRTSPEAMAQAFGIAAQTAPAIPGLAGILGGDVKEGIGWGSVTGLASLQLARAGFTGPTHIFDAAHLFNAPAMLEGLGGTPLIEGTYFKPFGCCRHIHGPLDAYLTLATQHALDVRQIARIQVHTYRATFNLSNTSRPPTLIDAQYSVPYCLALCALHGASALVPIAQRHLGDEDVLALAERITVHHDPDIEPFFPARSPAWVEVQMADGRVLKSPLTDPRGDPTRPLSWSELQSKFITATRESLPLRLQGRVLKAADLLRQGDIEPLRAALRLCAEQ